MTSIINAATAAKKYPVRPGYKTASGSAVRDVGDEVARALRGTGLGYWLYIAERNGCRGHLDAMIATNKNNGQIRLVLGQILRARLRAHKADPDTNERPFLPVAATPDPKNPGQRPDENTPAPQPVPQSDDPSTDDDDVEDSDVEQDDVEEENLGDQNDDIRTSRGD